MRERFTFKEVKNLNNKAYGYAKSYLRSIGREDIYPQIDYVIDDAINEAMDKYDRQKGNRLLETFVKQCVEWRVKNYLIKNKPPIMVSWEKIKEDREENENAEYTIEAYRSQERTFDEWDAMRQGCAAHRHTPTTAGYGSSAWMKKQFEKKEMFDSENPVKIEYQEPTFKKGASLKERRAAIREWERTKITISERRLFGEK